MSLTKNETKISTGSLVLQRVAAVRQTVIEHVTRQRGFTLIELCVVMSIMGVLAIPMVNWTIELFTAPVQAMEISNQQANAKSVSEAVDSPLRQATELTVGVRQLDGKINPLTMAGDQMVFTLPDGRCYRIYYLAHGIDQLREAESDNGCASIMPTRGPNQLVAGQYTVSPGFPLYDPELDDPGENSTLLSPTVWTDAAGTDEVNIDNQPLTYLDTGRLPEPVDATANSDSDNHFYSSPGAAFTRISGVTLLMVFGSTGSGPLAVKPTAFKQTISTQVSE